MGDTGGAGTGPGGGAGTGPGRTGPITTPPGEPPTVPPRTVRVQWQTHQCAAMAEVERLEGELAEERRQHQITMTVSWQWKLRVDELTAYLAVAR